jgi:hypothetical protein
MPRKKKQPVKPKKRERLRPLSLHPLKAEEALGLFMQVDPTSLVTETDLNKIRVGTKPNRRCGKGRASRPKEG